MDVYVCSLICMCMREFICVCAVCARVFEYTNAHGERASMKTEQSTPLHCLFSQSGNKITFRVISCEIMANHGI